MSNNYQMPAGKSFDFTSQIELPFNSYSSKEVSHCQNLSSFDMHPSCIKVTDGKPLPRIDGIITSSINPNNYVHNNECKDLYCYMNRNSDEKNMKELAGSSQKFSASNITPGANSYTLQLDWDKPKSSNSSSSPISSPGTSFEVGNSGNVIDHFDYKGQKIENMNSSNHVDQSFNDLPVNAPYELEPETVLQEDRETIFENDDNDSVSSTESASTFSSFELESKNEDKSKFIKCNECGLYVWSKSTLKVHMRLHTGIYPYVCKECGEAFPSCSLFYKHKLQHSNVKDKFYTCNECVKSFNCEKHFKVHRRKHLGPKMFDCPECKQSFATRDRLIRHSKIHFGDSSYFCEKCGELFYNKLRFDEHKMSHVNSSWKCEDCNKCAFGNPQELEHHILNIHDPRTSGDEVMQPVQLPENNENKKFACEICSMKLDKISDYYIHRCNHKIERPFKCELCSAYFAKEYHLSIHSACHRAQTFNCETCEASFSSKKSLKMHKQTHIQKLPHSCCHCDSTFINEEELLAHMKTHRGEKPYSCDQCEANFRHSSTLKMHQRIHTGETPFICSVCGASFIQSHHLQIHLRSHSSNKPYKCNECNASFTKKDYLFAHKTKHINEGIELIASGMNSDGTIGNEMTNLQCSYCEMTFSHQSTLSAHVRKHTGERPFVCDKCGASFLYSSNLTTHRRKHTGERPYKCKECDASFTLKSYLTMHLRKHSGERPFKCDICEASFTQKTHLSTHKRIHTGEYPYKCEICGDAFRDGANFWRHKKRHTESVKEGSSGNSYSQKPKIKKLRTKTYNGDKLIPTTPSFVNQRFLDSETKTLKGEDGKLVNLIEGNDCEEQSRVPVKTETFS